MTTIEKLKAIAEYSKKINSYGYVRDLLLEKLIERRIIIKEDFDIFISLSTDWNPNFTFDKIYGDQNQAILYINLLYKLLKKKELIE